LALALGGLAIIHWDDIVAGVNKLRVALSKFFDLGKPVPYGEQLDKSGKGALWDWLFGGKVQKEAYGTGGGMPMMRSGQGLIPISLGPDAMQYFYGAGGSYGG